MKYVVAQWLYTQDDTSFTTASVKHREVWTLNDCGWSDHVQVLTGKNPDGNGDVTLFESKCWDATYAYQLILFANLAPTRAE